MLDLKTNHFSEKNFSDRIQEAETSEQKIKCAKKFLTLPNLKIFLLALAI